MVETSYQNAYKSLNARQREAVDHIDGPLLVIAGPGTGKTQLLSTRAAHIVQLGSASPQNILCLTYTETGATEMRLRLARIMGPAGGDVAVHTFHSFGTWLIDVFPELFSQVKSLRAIDDLTRHRILENILSGLPLRHALAVRDENERFLRQGSVQTAIEAFKKAGYSPAAAREVLARNTQDYERLQPLLDTIFGSTLSAKRLPEINAAIEAASNDYEAGSYGELMLQSLSQAVNESDVLGKTKPLGDWRTKHMQFVNKVRVLKSAARHQALLDVLDIYETYQHELAEEGRFDYDDMVLWAVKALQENEDLRLDIAERFQYIMVDEYQDTNGAQNALLDAILSANPLDAPNVMVVGDDDQAIMRFQGAELSGLLGFIANYEPAIVTLTDNYRSGQAVLDASRSVMTQTDERLETSVPNLELSKQLTAQNEPPQTTLTHKLYASETAQDQAIAEHVAALIKAGTSPSDIAIIGRKHKDLMRLVPFLNLQAIAINYDYRENILDDPKVVELLQLAEYVSLLSTNPKRADQLLPRVLAGKYWALDALQTYRLAADAKQAKASWLDTMLTQEVWRAKAEWLIAASSAVLNENFTTGLDILLGRTTTNNATVSPFAAYFQPEHPERYVRLISHVITLRKAVLDSRPSATSLQDMLAVVSEYRRSGIKLVDNNPLLRGEQDGVTLLSAHGAKGREFEHVIIMSAVDNVWGNRARGHNQRIHLPENLPLYPAGDNESDRLRLLYVAMTRAKSDLLITSFEQTDEGKAVVPLTYILGAEAWEPQSAQPDSAVQALETAWLPATQTSERDLQSVIAPLLTHFRLSPTALRQFLDICYSGPATFLESSVLGFPSAYTASTALGHATHTVLEQAQRAYAADQPMDTKAILELFNNSLDASGLPADELQAVRSHGEQFLPDFVASFSASDFGRITSTEQYFKADLDGVPFGGKLDAIIEDEQGITVIDYKTGKPPLPNWETKGLTDSKKISLHFNRQQLMIYKLLLDAIGKPVDAAELIFVEPSAEHEGTVRLRIDDFSAEELATTKKLISKVYDCLKRGELPDISNYSKDLKGIQQFEADLLAS